MPYNPASLKNLRQPWQKGQCGNPSGRGILEGTIRKALEEPDPKTKRAKIEEVVNGLIDDATVKRDKEAIKILFERGYGKSVQPIEGNIGATITLADAIDALINQPKQ